MDSQWLQALLTWVEANPAWAGLLVGLISFTESLALVGILIPGVFILFGLGALIGLGALNFAEIWIWASAGALMGDAASFWLGHRYRDSLNNIWPFSKHPESIVQGRKFIQRHGVKSIVLGRFIGPLRPVVPVTAGMLNMSYRRFFSADIPAVIAWSPAYLAPGLLFGASLEVASEYAGRLALVAAVFVGAVWFTLWLVRVLYEWFTPRSAHWIRRGIRWSRRHPLMGGITRALLDPNHPEALSIAMLGMSLVIAFWAMIILLLVQPILDSPVALDRWFADLAVAARNDLTDPLMIALTQLGRWPVLATVSVIMCAWLLLLKRYKAAAHWVVAVAGGGLLQLLLGRILNLTPVLASSPAAVETSPSAAMVPATVVFGFFAVMIARDMQRSHRRWPYLATAALLMALAIARLYLGLDSASAIFIGFLLGGCWTAGVGIAYRQRASRFFSAGLTSLVFYGSLLLTIYLIADYRQETGREDYTVPLPPVTLQLANWPSLGWAEAPQQRSRFGSEAAREFNLQYHGDLQQLQTELLDQGWQHRPNASWLWPLQSLNPNANSDSLPLPSRDYKGRSESLRLHRIQANGAEVASIRFWDAGIRFDDGSKLWLGQLVEESIHRHLRLISYWRAEGISSDLPEFFRDTSVLLESRDEGRWLLLRQAEN